MNIIWGIILVSITLKVWIGQIIIAFFPKIAKKINIIESNVDKTFFLVLRGEAIWDALTLWILPLAGILLILNNSLWTYFGLIGGGMYLYFAGRSLASNFTLHHNGINIGKSKKLKNKLIILTLWGVMSVVTIIIALLELSM